MAKQGLLEFFDHIFVISLRRRRDRRARIARELRRMDLVLGCGGAELFDAIEPSDADGFPSRGDRGNLLSHQAVARRALEEQWERILVLEDDAVFTAEMLLTGIGLLKSLQDRPWHIAFPGHHGVMLPPGDPTWLALRPERLGMHCYGMTRAVLPAWVDYVDGVKVRPAGHRDGARFGCDPALQMFCAQNPWVVALLARPVLAIQGSSASDLRPRWFDQVPLLRSAAALARQVKCAAAGRHLPWRCRLRVRR